MLPPQACPLHGSITLAGIGAAIGPFAAPAARSRSMPCRQKRLRLSAPPLAQWRGARRAANRQLPTGSTRYGAARRRADHCACAHPVVHSAAPEHCSRNGKHSRHFLSAPAGGALVLASGICNVPIGQHCCPNWWPTARSGIFAGRAGPAAGGEGASEAAEKQPRPASGMKVAFSSVTRPEARRCSFPARRRGAKERRADRADDPDAEQRETGAVRGRR